jgi:hypothetical protein
VEQWQIRRGGVRARDYSARGRYEATLAELTTEKVAETKSGGYVARLLQKRPNVSD